MEEYTWYKIDKVTDDGDGEWTVCFERKYMTISPEDTGGVTPQKGDMIKVANPKIVSFSRDGVKSEKKKVINEFHGVVEMETYSQGSDKESYRFDIREEGGNYIGDVISEFLYMNDIEPGKKVKVIIEEE